jgi:hypothetical protein
VIERTALARLELDEHYMQRRRANVQNFGSGWLKPPGVPKTLHQMREEKREQEEHQEALRREQLAQELAEAEAADMPEDGTMDDVQLDGARDLDEEIPEAGDDFALSMDEDEDDDDDDDDDDEEEEEEEEDDDDGVGEASILSRNGVTHEDALRAERQNELVAARMLRSGDAFREALIRGEPEGDDVYGEEENFEVEEHGHMLDEEDFGASGLDDGAGFDMDANLDDDIPEAESGGYEHTDSEAELSSSSDDGHDDDDDDEADQDISFAPRAAPLGPPDSPTMRGRASTSGPRSSMDLSNLLSQDESSFMNSSPAQGRRARHG